MIFAMHFPLDDLSTLETHPVAMLSQWRCIYRDILPRHQFGRRDSSYGVLHPHHALRHNRLCLNVRFQGAFILLSR